MARQNRGHRPQHPALSQHFEFGGPYGPGALLLLLPAWCYMLDALARGFTPWAAQAYKDYIPVLSAGGVLVVLSWLAAVLFLHLALPGARLEGGALASGGRLRYKLNAFWVLAVMYPLAVSLSFGTHKLDLTWVYYHLSELLTGMILCSTAIAVLVYARSFEKGKALAKGGDTGYAVYDFWMGRELNPRLGGVDIKEFLELYPGLIGWTLINLSMAYAQKRKHGYISNSMWLVNGFELAYVVDALWNEHSILTTMDIASDGLGFMLCFGDLTWVPFVYSAQARFLVDHPKELPLWSVACILAVNMLGYYIFRASNGQKDTFRRDPNHASVQHLRTMPTSRGTKLLISGWWGASRHINYFGDWLMGLAWCLPCGVPTSLQSAVAYFYAVYFATLLIHRQRRDDHGCRQKYGKDWDKYCSLVPYRIIPYVY